MNNQPQQEPEPEDYNDPGEGGVVLDLDIQEMLDHYESLAPKGGKQGENPGK